MIQQVLTVSCKLGVEEGLTQEIDATLQGFADCCNWINSTVDPKATGRLAIHKETYHLAKQLFGLPANLICQAISRVASNRKTAKLKARPVKKFKPTSAGYDARIFSFNEHNWTVKMTLRNGRYSFPLLIGDYQRHLLSGETPTSATLIKRQSGEYYIQIQVKPPIGMRDCGREFGGGSFPLQHRLGNPSSRNSLLLSHSNQGGTLGCASHGVTPPQRRAEPKPPETMDSERRLAGGSVVLAVLATEVPRGKLPPRTLLGEVSPAKLAPPPHSAQCLGVDLGRRSIAYTSEGDNWDADAINRLRDHYTKLRKILQQKASKGTRSSRRRCREFLKRLSGKEKRFQAWLNHTISYRIVKSAASNKKIVALEDLTGIREDLNQEPRKREERRRTNSWAFYQLRVFLTYKCLKFGVKLITVSPAYTSKSCASCLRIGSRSGKSFSCKCGWKCDADHNASIVISRLGATVNLPKGSGLFCSLDRDDSGLLKASSMPQAWAG